MRVSHPIFASALLCNREYLGGGDVRNQLSSTVYMPILEVVQKELLLLAHSCGERYSPQAAEARKAQFDLGFSALMLYDVHSINCHIERDNGVI